MTMGVLPLVLLLSSGCSFACGAVPDDSVALFQRTVSQHGNSEQSDLPKPNSWVTDTPIMSPGSMGSFDEQAVKDPSIVFHNGSWHVFFTARGREIFSLGYASAPTLRGLGAAPRVHLSQLAGNYTVYAAAPQVFYFEPHKLWYLLYQWEGLDNKSTAYMPVYSVNPDVSNPSGWSTPQPLMQKDSQLKWIDFWVICDDADAYLFYTREQSQIMVRKTSIGNFPSGGWSKATKVLDGVLESGHVYKVRGRPEYHMFYEVLGGGVRSFGKAVAPTLMGPWRKEPRKYAHIRHVQFVAGKQEPWTEVVSHGEALRTGVNQLLEYEPSNVTWLVQGMPGLDDGMRPYDELEWSLGLINLTAPLASSRE